MDTSQRLPQTRTMNCGKRSAPNLVKRPSSSTRNAALPLAVITTLKAFSDSAETTSRPPSATTAAVGSLELNARLLALLSLLKQALT
ncbi:hypothetical protein M233_00030 [Xylella fastidiosa subsp. multiplex Griffin-1]|nr:hypothetical protein M233_00030 [Xylella fastidiosa subsp. multiplex Griffin-1]